jgi:hypothetical protein
MKTKALLLLFVITLLCTGVYAQTAYVFTKQGYDVAVTAGSSQYWFPRGMNTIASKQGNSLNITRSGVAVINVSFLGNTFSLNGYLPSTLDSLVYALNTDYFQDSIPSLGSVEIAGQPVQVYDENTEASLSSVVYNQTSGGQISNPTPQKLYGGTTKLDSLTGEVSFYNICLLSVSFSDNFRGNINGVGVTSADIKGNAINMSTGNPLFYFDFTIEVTQGTATVTKYLWD